MAKAKDLVAELVMLVNDTRNLVRTATGLLSIIEQERLHPPKFLTSEELLERITSALQLHPECALDSEQDVAKIAADLTARMITTMRVMVREP